MPRAGEGEGDAVLLIRSPPLLQRCQQRKACPSSLRVFAVAHSCGAAVGAQLRHKQPESQAGAAWWWSDGVRVPEAGGTALLPVGLAQPPACRHGAPAGALRRHARQGCPSHGRGGTWLSLVGFGGFWGLGFWWVDRECRRSGRLDWFWDGVDVITIGRSVDFFFMCHGGGKWRTQNWFFADLVFSFVRDLGVVFRVSC